MVKIYSCVFFYKGEFVTPPMSPILTDDSSSDEDDMCMAPEAKSTFIEG